MPNDTNTPKQVMQTLQTIQEQTGVILTHCPDFPKLRTRGGVRFFNAVLQQRTTESNDMRKLEVYAKKYGTIRVSPNGLYRVAIYITQK